MPGRCDLDENARSANLTPPAWKAPATRPHDVRPCRSNAAQPSQTSGMPILPRVRTPTALTPTPRRPTTKPLYTRRHPRPRNRCRSTRWGLRTASPVQETPHRPDPCVRFASAPPPNGANSRSAGLLSREERRRQVIRYRQPSLAFGPTGRRTLTPRPR